MSLDGLRAWIDEVERKLGARTRVFLALAAIAIGGAAAAVYLAVEAQNNDVSESDVQALQDRLEEQISGAGLGDGGKQAELEADLKALEAEVEQLREEDRTSTQGEEKQGADKAATDADGKDGGSADASEESAEAPPGTDPGGAAVGNDKLRELIEKAKKKSEEAEEAK
jgi:hypothetical protein